MRETANRSVIWLRTPLTLPTVPLTTSSSVFTFQGCLFSLYFDDFFSNIFQHFLQSFTICPYLYLFLYICPPSILCPPYLLFKGVFYLDFLMTFFSNIFYSSIFFFIFLLPHNIVFSSQGWPGCQSFIKCKFLPHKRCGLVFSINKKYFFFKNQKLFFFCWKSFGRQQSKFSLIQKTKTFFSFEDEKVLIFIFIGSNLADGKASSLPSVSITSTKLCSFGRRENKNIFHSKQIFFFSSKCDHNALQILEAGPFHLFHCTKNQNNNRDVRAAIVCE